MGAAPSRNIPEVVDRITAAFLADRQNEESFQGWVQRTGKPRIRAMLEDLLTIPAFEVDPTYYSDWGDPRVFSTGDIGVGECAGEVVDSTDFDLLASEREVFEAQDRLDKEDVRGAADIAYRAMLLAAKALAKRREPMISDDPHEVFGAFKRDFYDTQVFFDPFAGAKFARYYLRAHEEKHNGDIATAELARKRIEEAQLFVEAAHACYARIGQGGAP